MTRKVFFSITAMVILVLSPIQQLYAKDGSQIKSRAFGLTQPEQHLTVTVRTPEQIRAEMNAIYDELEATVKYLSDYAIGRNAFQQIGYEGIFDVVSSVTACRTQLQAMSDNSLLEANIYIPNSTKLKKIAASLHKMRFDPDFQIAMDRAEKWFNSESSRSSGSEAASPNARSTPSAPSFIKPVCHFDNLLNYPSAKDLSIAKAFALVGEIVFLLVPSEVVIPVIGVQIPNPIRIALAIAWGITEAISLGLDQARSEGVYCQTLALNMQGFMTNDAKFNLSVLLPRDAGGFADFLKDMVTASIQIATSKGIPVQCASTRLAEADAFYSQSKWADAYKKYRAAYQNIGASSCI
ncbi:MAG: hypothetical protein ACKVZH_22410 [Blastocatellia bacterium]